MTRISKIAAVALTSLTVATAFSPAAEARYWRRGYAGGAVAAGVIGALAVGAIAASAARPAYAAPVVVEDECYRKHVGYTAYGRPVYRTVCY